MIATVKFKVFLPFSKVWKEFDVDAGVGADAYELKLKDKGIKYARSPA